MVNESSEQKSLFELVRQEHFDSGGSHYDYQSFKEDCLNNLVGDYDMSEFREDIDDDECWCDACVQAWHDRDLNEEGEFHEPDATIYYALDESVNEFEIVTQ